MRIVAFGTYDVCAHPRVGALIEGLRGSGDDVVEVNRPLGLDTAARVAMLRQPWRLPLLLVRLVVCWSWLWRQGRTVRRTFAPEVVLVGYLGHFDVHLARLLFPRSTIVLDHLVSASGTASDRGLASGRGPKAALMRAIDSRALAAADVIVVDTVEHLEALPGAVRDRGVVCPVGATAPWFAAADPDRAVGDRLRVVFVGVFTPLHGTPTIARAIAALADDQRVEFTMVGTGQDHDEARRLASGNRQVTWIDWIDGTELPAVVAAHDVSIGIVGTTPKALAVVPTKAYQGAAAACCVVTSDTRAQRAALEGAASFVPPGDAPALASRLRELADSPTTVQALRRAAHQRAVERFTAPAVVQPLRDHLTRTAFPHRSEESR